MNRTTDVTPSGQENEDEQVVTLIMMLAAWVLHKKRRRRIRTMAEWTAALDSLLEAADEESDEDGPQAKRPRTVNPRPEYEQSAWAVMLRSPELANPTSKEATLFRRRFRVPHKFFLQIAQMVKER